MMRWSHLKIPILACLVLTSPAWAAENLPVEKLAVQRHVQRLVRAMEFGFGSLWMIQVCDTALGRVDAENNKITDVRIEGLTTPQTIAIGEAAVWVSDRRRKAIFKIDPNTYSVVRVIRVPALSPEGIMAIGEGSLWVLTATPVADALTRFNAQSGLIEATIPLPSEISSVVVANGSVWATGYAKNELYRINPRTNAVSSITKLHNTPRFMTAGGGSIWVLNEGDASVQKIDAENGELVATIETGLRHGTGSIAMGGGYVWVATPGAPITQIDPQTATSVRSFVGGLGMRGPIRYGAGSIWVGGGRIARLQAPN
jgi:virginiamycin B lyase